MMDDSQLIEIAKTHGTPVYVYDGDLIVNRCKTFLDAFKGFPAKVKCCYAVKANTNLTILKIIKNMGYGADIVSLGELDAVLTAGFSREDIVYTSNSKSRSELQAAVDAKINITVGNTTEIDYLADAGGDKIAFRVNPDVDAKTHPKISTSLMGSKFGLHIEQNLALCAVEKALERKLKVVGIHCHIGSNVKEMSGFIQAAEKMIDFAVKIKSLYNVELDFIDLGGGLGVKYKDEQVTTAKEFANSYVDIVSTAIEKLGYKPVFWFEPGRYIVAESGVLLTAVNSVKKTPTKTFVNVDTGFNSLIRPVMYDAYHHIRSLNVAGMLECDIAGNLCESGDILGRDRVIGKVGEGDILAVENAGAYGYSMSSNYNSKPKPPEVLVRGDKIDLIRVGEKIPELYLRQVMPKDLI